MLVLTRKLGDEIQIGDNIRLKVVAISGNRVRLGITAPIEIRIHRGELGPPAEDAVAPHPMRCGE
jgi:carbon storage regulator CsrA